LVGTPSLRLHILLLMLLSCSLFERMPSGHCTLMPAYLAEQILLLMRFVPDSLLKECWKPARKAKAKSQIRFGEIIRAAALRALKLWLIIITGFSTNPVTQCPQRNSPIVVLRFNTLWIKPMSTTVRPVERTYGCHTANKAPKPIMPMRVWTTSPWYYRWPPGFEVTYSYFWSQMLSLKALNKQPSYWMQILNE